MKTQYIVDITEIGLNESPNTYQISADSQSLLDIVAVEKLSQARKNPMVKSMSMTNWRKEEVVTSTTPWKNEYYTFERHWR